MIATGGYFACDFCHCEGYTSQQPGEKKGVHYLPDEPALARSVPTWKEILQNNVGDYTRARDQGVVRDTPLLRVEGFDPVMGVVLDPMHALYQGLFKQMYFALFFETSRMEVVKRRDDLQKILSLIKLPSEVERRSQPLTADSKAVEYKVIALFSNLVAFTELFPDKQRTGKVGADGKEIVKDMPRNKLVRNLLAHLTFLCRAIEYNNERYSVIRTAVDLQEYCKIVQRSWVEATTEDIKNKKGEVVGQARKQPLSYNGHLLQHLIEARDFADRPASEFSAEAFESLYGDCRKYYKKGTISTGKQILIGFYMQHRCHHRCGARRRDRPKFKQTESKKTDDSLIMLSNGNYARIVKIIDQEDTDDKLYKCHPVLVKPFASEDGLRWNLVGVWLYDCCDSSRPFTATRAEIVGKLIRVGVQPGGRGELVCESPFHFFYA